MRPIVTVLCLLMSSLLIGQEQLFASLFDTYDTYREPSIEDRRFKHSDIVPLLEALEAPFEIAVAGQSVEGRDIYTVTVGSGSTTVLLWSQMHGDEPTATAALFDIFRFLSSDNAQFRSLRQRIFNNLKLVFIPMLNPDGAERFERRNAYGIDLNRDALRLVSPEAQLLKRIRDELDADWGFNLHDQSRYYGAGYPTDDMATLSFLAPAYNFARDVNPGRERAMQLIAQMNAGLQAYLPNRIARYSDAFEPRAFGDNIQLWGTSTILIESGGYPGDREKQYIRKLNYVGLLGAFSSIADGGFQRFSRSAYNRIPYNRGGVFNDLLLREVQFMQDGQSHLIDIAFDLDERDYRAASNFFYIGGIDDVGDLMNSRGYVELAPENLTAEFAYMYPELFENMEELQAVDPLSLLREGYVVVRVRRLPPPWERDQLPFHVVGADASYDQAIEPGANPPLILREQGGDVKYVVVNGQLHELDEL